jgi:hypothetical protein
MPNLVQMVIALSALMAFGSVLFPEHATSQFGSTLLFFLPGIAFGIRLLDGRLNLARLVMLAGISYSIACIALLLTAYFPGELSRPWVMLAPLLLTLSWCLIRAPRVSWMETNESRASLLAIGAIITVAFIWRFGDLGSAEFQGDEARAMIIATGLAQGEDDILFAHRKGPVEALLASPSLLVSGHTSEFIARAPFTLAGALISLAVYCLIRRIRPESVLPALLAAGWVSVDGYLFAFARIVQYQSIVVLLLLGALLTIVELKASLKGLAIAAMLVGCSLLAHYDAILACPALAFIACIEMRRDGSSYKDITKRILFPGALLLGLLAIFYLPFLLNQHFGSTSNYLAARVGVSSLPVNNLSRHLKLYSFYSSSYFVWITFIFLTVGSVQGVLAASSSRKKVAGLIFLGIFAAQVVLSPSLLKSQSISLALAISLAAMTTVIVSSKNKSALLSGIWIWAATTLLAFGFFVARPNTHFYVWHAPSAILVAIAAFDLMRGLNLYRSGLGIVAPVLLVCTYLFSLHYLNHVFRRPEIEFRFAHLKAPVPYYQTLLSEESPAGVYFGFQRRSGWKVIGSLVDSKEIQGTYGSNEEELITSWYVKGLKRDQVDPDYFFVATRPNDVVDIPEFKIRDNYHFWGRIYCGGRRTMEIFSKSRPHRDPKRFDLEDYIERFDSLPGHFTSASAALRDAPSR